MIKIKVGTHYTLGGQLIVFTYHNKVQRIVGEVVRTKIHSIVQQSETVEMNEWYGEIKETTEEELRNFWSLNPLSKTKKISERIIGTDLPVY